MAKVTIKKSEIISLIKEETERFNKIKSLEEKKTQLLKELCECGYSMEETPNEDAYMREEEMEEGLFGKKPTPEELQKIGLEVAMAHPGKKQAYEKLNAENPEKAAKLLAFYGANPRVKYIKWDNNKQIFVDGTIYTQAMGPGSQSGAALPESKQ